MIKNALDCGDKFLGSGQRDCVISSLGDLLGNVLFSNSNDTKWNDNTPLTRQSYMDAVKNMKAFPYMVRYDVAENTADNEVNTSSVGVITPIRQGKPQWQFMFDKGLCYHKSLYNKRNISWQVGLIFETGILLTETSNGDVRGFNSAKLNVQTYRLQMGTDPERSIADIQLLYPDEFNAKSIFYTWEALGFDMREINGVIDVDLEVIGSPSGSDEIVVKVTAKCNGADANFAGLDEVQYWSLSGTNETVSTVTYDTSTGEYTLTLSGNLATTGNVTLSLKEVGFSVVEDPAGELLKGSTVINLAPVSV